MRSIVWCFSALMTQRHLRSPRKSKRETMIITHYQTKKKFVTRYLAEEFGHLESNGPTQRNPELITVMHVKKIPYDKYEYHDFFQR